MDEFDDLPPFLDHRPNGRCRAYWTAYEHSPGNKVPATYAIETFNKFLEESKKLDDSVGMMTCCKPFPGWKKELKPIRTRNRGEKKI